MFALVLWRESNETSVVPVHDIRKANNEKRVTQAKWGKNWYPVQLIHTNAKKDFLETLHVNTDGEIITPDRRSSIPPNLIMKRRQQKKLQKETQCAQHDVIMERDKTINDSRPLYETPITENNSDSGSDSSDGNHEDSNFHQEEESSSVESDVEQEHGSIKSQETKNTREQRPCICSQFPSVTMDDINKLNGVLELAKNIHGAQNRIQTTSISVKNDEPVEIIEGSGIKVSRRKVNSILEMYCKQPQELVRKLMRLLLGDEKLMVMSPTGKNGREPIPQAIFEGVLELVNKNAPKKKYELRHKRYKEVLTAMCATLRNSKSQSQNNYKKAEEMKQNKSNDKSDPEKDEEEIEEDFDKEVEVEGSNKQRNIESTGKNTVQEVTFKETKQTQILTEKQKNKLKNDDENNKSQKQNNDENKNSQKQNNNQKNNVQNKARNFAEKQEEKILENPKQKHERLENKNLKNVIDKSDAKENANKKEKERKLKRKLTVTNVGKLKKNVDIRLL